MKWIFSLVLIALLLPSGSRTAIGQQLEARLGGGYFLHLKYRETNDPNIPDQFEDLGEEPSIASFFQNGLGLNLDLRWRIDGDDYYLFPGLMLDYASVKSKDDREFGTALGEDLRTTNVALVFGGGNDFPVNQGAWYAHAGLLMRFYSGKSTIPAGELSAGKVDATYDYDRAVGFRVGGGVETRAGRSVVLGLRVNIDIGKINRGTIHLKEEGFPEVEADPGDLNDLWDNQILLTVYAGYLFDFSKGRRKDPREAR